MASAEQCIHWMPKAACGFCNPIKPRTLTSQSPAHRKERTVYGTSAVDAEEIQGYVILATKKGHRSFEEINETTTLVHILGHPFLWALVEILARGPNLRTIRILPTVEGKLSDRHTSLCRDRQVQLVTGYYMPQMAWEKGENRSRSYQTQQRFLRNLEGEQKDLFAELLTFGFEAALITSRYYCLQGEEFLTQPQLCTLFGYAENMAHNISQKINTVLFYLDPTFNTGKRSKEMAETFKLRVPRLRSLLRTDVDRKKFHDEFLAKNGIPIPTNFPFARLETLEKLLEAQKKGDLDLLRDEHPEIWKTLMLRYGLDSPKGGTYRTMLEVAEIIGGITKQGIQQREIRAFLLLGITPPD